MQFMSEEEIQAFNEKFGRCEFCNRTAYAHEYVIVYHISTKNDLECFFGYCPITRRPVILHEKRCNLPP